MAYQQPGYPTPGMPQYPQQPTGGESGEDDGQPVASASMPLYGALAIVVFGMLLQLVGKVVGDPKVSPYILIAGVLLIRVALLVGAYGLLAPAIFKSDAPNQVRAGAAIGGALLLFGAATISF